MIGSFTEGTHYCKLQIPKQFIKNFSTGAKVETGSGGNQFDERSAMRAYTLMAEGIEASVANADLVEQFCMSERHTSGVVGTFFRYYLIIRFAASSYVKFTDSGGTRRDYCKGIILNGAVIWNKSKPLVETVKLNWASVW